MVVATRSIELWTLRMPDAGGAFDGTAFRILLDELRGKLREHMPLSDLAIPAAYDSRTLADALNAVTEAARRVNLTADSPGRPPT
jgi:hypothetical protein